MKTYPVPYDIAETNENRLNELKGKLNLEEATNDWKKLIKNPEIDTVIISATPEDTLYPMALLALQSGKNVFLEKPIATTMAEAEELIEISIKNSDAETFVESLIENGSKLIGLGARDTLRMEAGLCL